MQIIFNIFRQRPAELFFGEANRRGVGILVRLPLSSGLLTGKFKPDTPFEADDHRAFNRQGEAFDRGETFSGVPYALGLKAVDALRPLTSQDMTMAQMALRWILMFPAVTCAIPGAKRPAQVEENVRAADLPPLADETMKKIRTVYDTHIRGEVHHRW